MGLAKREIELNRDIVTFNERYRVGLGTQKEELEKQEKRKTLLFKRASLKRFFK